MVVGDSTPGYKFGTGILGSLEFKQVREIVQCCSLLRDIKNSRQQICAFNTTETILANVKICGYYYLHVCNCIG